MCELIAIMREMDGGEGVTVHALAFELDRDACSVLRSLQTLRLRGRVTRHILGADVEWDGNEPARWRLDDPSWRTR